MDDHRPLSRRDLFRGKLFGRLADAVQGFDQHRLDHEAVIVVPMEARPIATLSLEAQERHERRERVHRDD